MPVDMSVDILILNYNGQDLLAQCLPSVIEAAAASRHCCAVGVIDNASSDGSVAWLQDRYPQVEIFRCRNHGLCSYNDVLRTRDSRVAILLNNDIRLDRNAVDPLVAPLLDSEHERTTRRVPIPPECHSWWMTTAHCRQFDEVTYEGLLTSICCRYGLVQATALFAGCEQLVSGYHPTASAGALMAVDRLKFLELGGFDPLYFPGRLEDLDLAFRAYLQGYAALYVPDSVAYHGGERTFQRELGRAGSHRLALRNTLLWQVRNIRNPLLITRLTSGLAFRLLVEATTAPWQRRERRFSTWRALRDAFGRWRASAASNALRGTYCNTSLSRRKRWWRERAYFRRFHPRNMIRNPATMLPATVLVAPTRTATASTAPTPPPAFEGVTA